MSSQSLVLAALLAHDASVVNARDASGWTALHWAAAVESAECVARLLAVPAVEPHAESRQRETDTRRIRGLLRLRL